MGYTTDFEGSFELSVPANAGQIEYINTFSFTRRMKRNVVELMKLYNGQHGLEGVGYGEEGEYFCYDDGDIGQKEDSSIINSNLSPSTQPGLWCQWVLSEDGQYLEWDGGEKFYNYVEWLEYMIKNFFDRWGIKLNGEVRWYGEDRDDIGLIEVVDNTITIKKGEIKYEL